ncbi:type ISP restriction/modification enzyme [Neotabrizicola shimadae]|uniref:site-specific DNA-methyltransferase (adenine-specific) n=1 Tax=Neotabrizicola shimadae TaxID=2807096 RepID=A0A8G0ZUF1_9RHOB|nr:type ISP restriction/modification enzyme [Neotabrizicola shimadae]QYZ68835.1 N-6 DNA methylase [Neotabrizicola shimadae]
MVSVADFVVRVKDVYKTGIAGEHAYRPALHDLLKALGDDLTPVNDAKKSEVGAPDFIVLKGDIPIGHLEAKDINLDIRALKDANKKQQDRYKAGLSNLIYTNCLDWDFYRNGQLVASVTIADFLMGIQPKPEEYATLENLLRDFVAQRPQSITTPRDLAERMAGKAVLIKDVLFQTLRQDKDLQTDLAGQYKAFKEHLIHDISLEDFADIYAETIAYGMFAARLHDTSLDSFSRFEALDLLPKSNPFLRDLFGFIAGATLDDRIAWVIDDLARVFQAANVKKLMEAFGKLTGQQDPFLHFYETFLAAYNPAKRKARGVWYTPEPVVNFIVRAVDEVLQTEFGLPDGLADTSKVIIDWDTGQTDPKGKPLTIKKEVHRVQILDPATGTGTFLAEVIKQIAPKVKNVAEGMWSPYIERDLIPRLHGFELLMASYAMCHMKLDMILTELGYKPTGTPPRLGVYLTNSLEEGEREVRDLFMAQWLTREAREANTIKRQTPIMCVIGNPPYSGHSSNKGQWIDSLLEPYKREPGGIERLRERNPKWLNDDYVKFLRFAESLIARTGEGVLGFITNHGYLDNPTFRGMRWHLLRTFDKIFVLDLHGNAKKNEVAPEGASDKNVFDIQQGVAIIIGVKRKEYGRKAGLARVYHGDLWGSREVKYDALRKETILGPVFSEITPSVEQLQFHPRDFSLDDVYSKGFSIENFFQSNVLGFQTHRDDLVISTDRQIVQDRLDNLLSPALSDSQVAKILALDAKAEASLTEQRKKLKSSRKAEDSVVACLYRPFDVRFCIMHQAVVDRPRPELIRNAIGKENLFLLASRQISFLGYRHCFVSTLTAESCVVSLKTKEQNRVFSLYAYPTEQDLDQSRRINFDPKLYDRLQALATHPTHGTPDEVAVFDYIYGVLHCPAYRATYAEFLKIDFPRIPWPVTPDEFWEVSTKGTALRKLHLMDPATIGPTPYPFKGEGSAVVENPRFEGGKVWINATQYFDNAPEVSWNFYIGGYQPAQKWLKDRKGRTLSFDDVKHYQRILKILVETDRIMQTITMTLGA